MHKIILFLFFSPLVLFGQGVAKNIVKNIVPLDTNINQFKYIIYQEIYSNKPNDKTTLLKVLNEKLKSKSYVVVTTPNSEYHPEELTLNPNIGLYLSAKSERRGIFKFVSFVLSDYYGNIIHQREVDHDRSVKYLFGLVLQDFISKPHKFTPNSIISKSKIKLNLSLPTSFDEIVVRDFLDSKNKLELYEGLYRYVSKSSNVESQYKFLILKEDFTYYGFIVEANCIGCQNWKVGDVKFKMNEGAISEILDVTWKYPVQERKRDKKIILTSKVSGNFLESSTFSLLKLYPKANSTSKRKISKNGGWAGNGSGVIISKSGHIITNHHVIKDAEKIEVEFMLDDELQKFNAEVVQVDKTNDLAVLKIFDMNFDGVSEPPYNFKFRGSDVGTKVYAFGYPMALSIMGKEIKVTDGMISSKFGFDDNITTYGITAPIQIGNSGGPLFDEQANLIGINSSGLKKDIADNVAYSIKTSYVKNLLDVLPKSIELPSSTRLKSLPLIEQIKEISKYVVLVKVK